MGCGHGGRLMGMVLVVLVVLAERASVLEVVEVSEHLRHQLMSIVEGICSKAHLEGWAKSSGLVLVVQQADPGVGSFLHRCMRTVAALDGCTEVERVVTWMPRVKIHNLFLL